MFEYRKGLPDRPASIAALPVDERGYPVPYFVKYIDGVPDFRVVDHPKIVRATNERKCFICGSALNQTFHFAMGPRSAIFKQTNHGPSHKDCIEYSLETCPFILYPNAQRRRAALPDIPLSYDTATQPARPPIYVIAHVPSQDVHIVNNVTSLVCSWTTVDYQFWRDDRWITSDVAEPYFLKEYEKYQLELKQVQKPDDWSPADWESWLQARQHEASEKLTSLLEWIKENEPPAP